MHPHPTAPLRVILVALLLLAAAPVAAAPADDAPTVTVVGGDVDAAVHAVRAACAACRVVPVALDPDPTSAAEAAAVLAALDAGADVILLVHPTASAVGPHRDALAEAWARGVAVVEDGAARAVGVGTSLVVAGVRVLPDGDVVPCGEGHGLVDVAAVAPGCDAAAAGQVAGLVAAAAARADAHGVEAPRGTMRALTAAELAALATATARDVTTHGAHAGWDPATGAGLVDAAALLTAAKDPRSEAALLAPDVVDAGGGGVAVEGLVGAHRAGPATWRLAWACGVDPAAGDAAGPWRVAATGTAATRHLGTLAHLDGGEVAACDVLHLQLLVADGRGRMTETRHVAPVTAGSAVVTLPDVTPARPVLADLDGDGRDDVLVPGRDGHVHALTPSGHAHAGWPVAPGPLADDGLAAADLDGDGRPEVVAVTRAGTLHVWDAHGAARAGSPVDAIQGKPVLVDGDGDGHLEIVVDGWTRAAWHDDGTTARATAVPDGTCALPPPTPDAPAGAWRAAVGDVDGDGLADVVAVDDHGRVTVTRTHVPVEDAPGTWSWATSRNTPSCLGDVRPPGPLAVVGARAEAAVAAVTVRLPTAPDVAQVRFAFEGPSGVLATAFAPGAPGTDVDATLPVPAGTLGLRAQAVDAAGNRGPAAVVPLTADLARYEGQPGGLPVLAVALTALVVTAVAATYAGRR